MLIHHLLARLSWACFSRFFSVKWEYHLTPRNIIKIRCMHVSYFEQLQADSSYCVSRQVSLPPPLFALLHVTLPHPSEGLCVLSHFSLVRLSETPWSIAHQFPLSRGFSRQEYWSGLPCPPPGDLPDPGIEFESLMSPALPGGFFTTNATWEAHVTLEQVKFFLRLSFLSHYMQIPTPTWWNY